MIWKEQQKKTEEMLQCLENMQFQQSLELGKGFELSIIRYGRTYAILATLSYAWRKLGVPSDDHYRNQWHFDFSQFHH